MRDRTAFMAANVGCAYWMGLSLRTLIGWKVLVLLAVSYADGLFACLSANQLEDLAASA